MFAVAVMLRELEDNRPLNQTGLLDLYAIQNRLAEKPSFEIHVLRAPCRICVKFVRLLSEVSGIPMIICVGAVVAESQEYAVIPKSLRQRMQDLKEHQEELGRFGPVPLEWPEDLRQVFAKRDGGARGTTLSVEPLEMREHHEFRSPGGEATHISQTPQGTCEEGGPRESRTASEGTTPVHDTQEKGDEDNRSNEVANAEDDANDLQEIDGYTYYYGSNRLTPDTPIPSIEQDHYDPRQSTPGRLTSGTDPDASPLELKPRPGTRSRTATTPEGVPLAVSPRTHIFIRGKEYSGPTYMPPRSPIHKPRPTPILTTPSYLRKRFRSMSPAPSYGERQRKRARSDGAVGGRLVVGERIESDYFEGRGDVIMLEDEGDILA